MFPVISIVVATLCFVGILGVTYAEGRERDRTTEVVANLIILVVYTALVTYIARSVP